MILCSLEACEVVFGSGWCQNEAGGNPRGNPLLVRRGAERGRHGTGKVSRHGLKKVSCLLLEICS